MNELEINSKELTKEMQDFLTCVSESNRDGGRSNLTIDDWLEEFGTEFPNIQGYYVTDLNIIESM